MFVSQKNEFTFFLLLLLIVMLDEIDNLACSYMPNETTMLMYATGRVEYLFKITKSTNMSFYKAGQFIGLLIGIEQIELDLVEFNGFLTVVTYTNELINSPPQKFGFHMSDNLYHYCNCEFEIEFCRIRNITTDRLNKIRRMAERNAEKIDSR